MRSQPIRRGTVAHLPDLGTILRLLTSIGRRFIPMRRIDGICLGVLGAGTTSGFKTDNQESTLYGNGMRSMMERRRHSSLWKRPRSLESDEAPYEHGPRLP